MKQIFVNLKRFDVPRRWGGVCPQDDPIAWIESIIAKSVELGLGTRDQLSLTYLLPEGLVAAAVRKLQTYSRASAGRLAIGCQGVHWDDVHPGKNFGAFTASVPARAAANLGSQWALLGHSEERRAKSQVISTFDPAVNANAAIRARAANAVDQLVHDEVFCALQAGMHVLLCIGESAEERGDGPFEEQQPRIERVLQSQLLNGLKDMEPYLQAGKVVIGYEPIWAIGPGKVPPGKDYISFVSTFIQRVVRQTFDTRTVVVYGGGLKEENAAMIASIETIGGGLVGLTRFTGEIGFSVEELEQIAAKYLEQ